MREDAGLARQLFAIDAAGDQDHLDRVGDALAPEAIGMPDPVGQRDGRVMGVEMARRRREYPRARPG